MRRRRWAADGQSLAVVFPDAKGEQWVALKPPAGRWDLRDATEVRVKLKNEGLTPITPSVQVTSNGGPTDIVTAAAPLNAGEETQLIASFIPAVPGKGTRVPKAGYYGNQPGTGTSFSQRCGRRRQDHGQARRPGEAAGRIDHGRCASGGAPRLARQAAAGRPATGSRRFDEEFDGPTIDQTKWNIYGPNYWDRASHWTKDNLILEDGMAKFRFEKKRGFHNDNSDPKVDPQNLSGQKQSDYACGYLDTYGKWVQRYGYFEARVKLPRAPGLWPTFWMIPDRGAAVGPHDKRNDTGNGGMELDIMEHLTRWGPYRYNIALHFDGYGKEHKSVGSPFNYVQADKDGFITPGLLWTAGLDGLLLQRQGTLAVGRSAGFQRAVAIHLRGHHGRLGQQRGGRQATAGRLPRRLRPRLAAERFGFRCGRVASGSQDREEVIVQCSKPRSSIMSRVLRSCRPRSRPTKYSCGLTKRLIAPGKLASCSAARRRIEGRSGTS